MILVQAALVTANFAAPVHLAETAHSVTDPSNQKSQVLTFLFLLVQVLPVFDLLDLDLLAQVLFVHFELEVKPTAD